MSGRPADVLGFGEALGQVSMSQMWPFTATAAAASGARAFQTAGTRPAEIDCAQLYDSFTITVLLALEDLGFCGKGEGGKFASAGELAPSGQLPINIDGGGLSSNHPGRAVPWPWSRQSGSCGAPQRVSALTARDRARARHGRVPVHLSDPDPGSLIMPNGPGLPPLTDQFSHAYSNAARRGRCSSSGA